MYFLPVVLFVSRFCVIEQKRAVKMLYQGFKSAHKVLGANRWDSSPFRSLTLACCFFRFRLRFPKDLVSIIFTLASNFVHFHISFDFDQYVKPYNDSPLHLDDYCKLFPDFDKSYVVDEMDLQKFCPSWGLLNANLNLYVCAKLTTLPKNDKTAMDRLFKKSGGEWLVYRMRFNKSFRPSLNDDIDKVLPFFFHCSVSRPSPNHELLFFKKITLRKSQVSDIQSVLFLGAYWLHVDTDNPFASIASDLCRRAEFEDGTKLFFYEEVHSRPFKRVDKISRKSTLETSRLHTGDIVIISNSKLAFLFE